MKVTRPYWLGLGSGLILSAMLTLVIPPQQRQAVIPEASPVPPVKQQASPQPVAAVVEPVKPPSTPPPSEATQQSQPQPTKTPVSTQIEQSFIIPKGASSQQISDLLVAQGFVKDKESFLVGAHQMGAESHFRAGTFTLSLGLTTEELIQRLLK